MAFISANSTVLARDLWPSDRGRMRSDLSTRETLPAHRVVPDTYEALCEWLCVDPCGIDFASSVWLHPDVVGEETRVEMTIRLQGFVKEASLGMLGNWNGTAQGAPKALQTLTLASGRCHDAFDPQLLALDNIRELVLKLLSRSASDSPADGHIHLRRRVFDRVRPGDDNDANIRVPLADDPIGRVKKMENMWAVRHRIEAGIQREDGRIERQNP